MMDRDREVTHETFMTTRQYFFNEAGPWWINQWKFINLYIDPFEKFPDVEKRPVFEIENAQF